MLVDIKVLSEIISNDYETRKKKNWKIQYYKKRYEKNELEAKLLKFKYFSRWQTMNTSFTLPIIYNIIIVKQMKDNWTEAHAISIVSLCTRTVMWMSWKTWSPIKKKRSTIYQIWTRFVYGLHVKSNKSGPFFFHDRILTSVDYS